jgi:hypothetical protein
MKKAVYVVCFAFMLLFPDYSLATVQVSPNLNGAGVRFSLVVPEHFNPGFGMGTLVDLMLVDWFHFTPGLEYSYVGHDVPSEFSNYPYYSTRHSLNDFSFTGDLRFYPPLRAKIHPYAGGGFTFVVSSENIHFEERTYPFDKYDTRTTDPGLGFDFLAGCDIPIGNVLVNLELKGKVGTGYSLLKFTGGLMFPINVSLLRGHRR